MTRIPKTTRTVHRILFLAALLTLPMARASAQCCDLLLLMQDSYGDGWNGGSLTVLINGTSIGAFAGQGSSSDVSLTVCDGDTLELVYAPADWEEENTYVLLNPGGSIVFADGPTPTPGVVFNTVANCSDLPLPGTAPCAALPIDTAACVTANNTGVTGTGLGAGCAEYQGGDVWYQMPVPSSGNVVISTGSTGDLNDTGIALWTGPDCFHLTRLACDDDSGPDYFSLVLANELPVGDSLWIQAFGYGGASGAFELCVSDPGTVVLDSSEIPIVLINTLGQTITDEPKIQALMQIKYNGVGNTTYVTDPANVYDGHVGIEVRGASSSGYPQRPYGFETRDSLGNNLDVSLLGMPEENDWVLLSNYNDRSLVKNQLAFALSAGMGQYAPRTHLCEVLVDSVYKGIYVLGEKIKRDNGRVDIARLNPDENTGDNLTGGYILTQNYWDNNNSFLSNYSPIDHPTFDVHFVHHYPEPDSITPQQRTYIAAYVDSLETALYADDFADTLTGYRRYLDVKSFIGYFLVNEVARSNDGFKKSVFFHKDKYSNGGKLKAGPVWDFDWAWKNIASCDIFSATDGSGWAHHVNDCPTDNYSCGWYIRLLQDSSFNATLRCTYETYRTSVLDTAYIFHFIDSIGDRVQFAQARHFQKWPILGQGGPAPDVGPVASTYAAELDSLKSWITGRLAWLDVNIPGLCQHVGMPVALAEQHLLRCYPNPSSGRVRFDGWDPANAPDELVILDLAMREVARVNVKQNTLHVEMEITSAGAYLYAVRTKGRINSMGKLIVQ